MQGFVRARPTDRVRSKFLTNAKWEMLRNISKKFELNPPSSFLAISSFVRARPTDRVRSKFLANAKWEMLRNISKKFELNPPSSLLAISSSRQKCSIFLTDIQTDGRKKKWQI